jgi:dsRNA-specific ribonuclease
MNFESYQRLEFLGDAVLDMVIVRLLESSSRGSTKSPGRMTSVKAALVNAHFLGFLCLDYGVESARVVGIEVITPGRWREKVASHTSRLWTLMRHTNSNIRASQAACEERYMAHRDAIREAFDTSTMYPWLPLARLNPDKFYSDIIESIIAAIFLDSGGNLVACEAFVARIGLVPYLTRVLTDEVDVRHPKSILSQLVGSERVSYNEKKLLGEHEDTGKQRYICTVAVGEVVTAESEVCFNREEAVLSATTKALEKYRLDMDE